MPRRCSCAPRSRWCRTRRAARRCTTKNQDAVILPIASITKLMTAIVILDARLDLEQRVVISGEDQDTIKGTRSRLRPGTVLTRSDLLLLALMSSENRAAFSLARTYPGGTRGLRRGDERQGARARHERHAFRRPDRPVLGQRVERAGPRAAGARGPRIPADPRVLDARAAPPCRRSAGRSTTATPTAWCATRTGTSALSKTGYISEAGRCLVMHVRLASTRSDRGAARFLGQALAHRRRQPDQEVARDRTPPRGPRAG